MARRAKGEGSIIHVQPIACKACPDYRSCLKRDVPQGHCSKRDRRDRWLYQYVVVGADGKKKKKALSATTRKALMEKIEKLQAQSEEGQRHEEVILGNWIESWKSMYLPHSVKPSTLRFYKYQEINDIIDEMSHIDMKSAKIIGEFFNKIEKVIQQMNFVLKTHKLAVIKISDSKIKHHKIETGKLMTHIAEQNGFKLKDVFIDKINENSRSLLTARNTYSDIISQDYIIIFRIQ